MRPRSPCRHGWWTPLRPATLVLAFVVSVAWPLSGFPLVAAVLATVAVGLKLARDRRCPGRPPRAWRHARGPAGRTGDGVGRHRRSRSPAPIRSSRPRRASQALTPRASTWASAGPRATHPAGPRRPRAPRASSATTTTPWTRRRFEAAWAVLAPAVRTAFGGFGRLACGLRGHDLEPSPGHRREDRRRNGDRPPRPDRPPAATARAEHAPVRLTRSFGIGRGTGGLAEGASQRMGLPTYTKR